MTISNANEERAKKNTMQQQQQRGRRMKVSSVETKAPRCTFDILYSFRFHSAFVHKFMLNKSIKRFINVMLFHYIDDVWLDVGLFYFRLRGMMLRQCRQWGLHFHFNGDISIIWFPFIHFHSLFNQINFFDNGDDVMIIRRRRSMTFSFPPFCWQFCCSD